MLLGSAVILEHTVHITFSTSSVTYTLFQKHMLDILMWCVNGHWHNWHNLLERWHELVVESAWQTALCTQRVFQNYVMMTGLQGSQISKHQMPQNKALQSRKYASVETMHKCMNSYRPTYQNMVYKQVIRGTEVFSLTRCEHFTIFSIF